MSIIMKKRHNKRRFGLYQSDWHLPRRSAAVVRLLTYLCALRVILRLKSKRDIDTIAAPRGFPTA